MNDQSRRITPEPLLPYAEALADVKLIGLGGVGGPVARYAGLYLAALDEDVRLVLVDGDTFEPTNANRMFFGGDGNKAEVIREDLMRYVGVESLMVEAIGEYVTPQNIDNLIREGDIVLLAVDNHATRKMVSDFCATQRQDVVLISGGNDGVGEGSDGRVLRGTAGNVQIYVRRDGVDVTPSLTEFHPEIREPQDEHPDDVSCTEMLASVPQIVFANLTVATCMLNAFWLYLCGALHYPELVFDIAEGLMRPIELRTGGGEPLD